MKKILVFVVVTLLAACAGVEKVENGQRRISERMDVTLDGAWNKINIGNTEPAQVWTMEGVYVDELIIYSGIKDGERMHPESTQRGNVNAKNFVFHGNMRTEDIVTMFEGVLTRDGSVFTLSKIEPAAYGGKPGFRFEYERVRKIDNLRQKGVGYGLVDKGQLFALVYHAPKLTFFARHAARVEAIAKTISIRD